MSNNAKGLFGMLTSVVLKFAFYVIFFAGYIPVLFGVGAFLAWIFELMHWPSPDTPILSCIIVVSSGLLYGSAFVLFLERCPRLREKILKLFEKR